MSGGNQVEHVQFLTVCTAFGPEVKMHLVPVEDVETVHAVAKLFASGDHDCSVGQTEDDRAIEAALAKYAPIDIMSMDDHCSVAVKPLFALPDGHCIVRVVTRYVYG
jgi:hypothetical protein